MRGKAREKRKLRGAHAGGSLNDCCARERGGLEYSDFSAERGDVFGKFGNGEARRAGEKQWCQFRGKANWESM